MKAITATGKFRTKIYSVADGQGCGDSGGVGGRIGWEDGLGNRWRGGRAIKRPAGRQQIKCIILQFYGWEFWVYFLNLCPNPPFEPLGQSTLAIRSSPLAAIPRLEK
jgi:hypothetical protein